MPNEFEKAGQITIDQLRTLVKVAEVGSYLIDEGNGRSATNTVRMSLQRLAIAIGDPDAPLAVPTTRGRVKLTDRGEQVLRYAHSVIGLIDELPDMDRPVKVAAYSSLILRMLQCAPDPSSLPFEFVPADSARADGGLQLTRRLANHDIDIAVAPHGLVVPRQKGLWLYSWELQAVGQLPADDLSTVARLCGSSRPVDNRPAVSLKNLAKHHLLVSPPGYRSRSVLQSAADLARLSLRIQFELADQGLMQRLTELTDWIAVMPNDAYGILDSGVGTAIVAGKNVLDGAYSVYYRTDLGKVQTEREQQILRAVTAIVDLFRPQVAALRPDVNGGSAR